jgi:hypothetical protein
MSRTLVICLVAAVAVFGAVWYFAGGAEESAEPPAVTQPLNEGAAKTPPAAAPAVSPTDPQGRPVPADPRLAALMVGPEDALIEYVKDRDGRVIQEIDNDPNSPRYRQPVREYLYAGGNVAGLTTYRHVGGQVEIVRVQVSYKPDGSVDQFREVIEHEKLAKPGN